MVALALLLVLVPGSALAQSTVSTIPILTSADEVHAKAEQLHASANTRSWADMALLLEEAASLRSADDARAIEELTRAGMVWYYLGSLARAQRLQEQAARLALENGRVLEAAHVYAGMAFLAKLQGHQAEASVLARTAQRLAYSPHLTPTERDGVLKRIT
jgi:hypothetical protein